MPLLARACPAGRGRGRAKSASFCALLAFFAPFSASLALLPAHFRAGFSHTLRAHGACHAAAVQSAKNGPGAPRRRLLCRFGGFFACLRHLCRRFSALRAAFRPKFSPATPLQHARANGAKKKFCIFGAEKTKNCWTSKFMREKRAVAGDQRGLHVFHIAVGHLV